MVWLQTHIPSILVSCPSHSCPTGPCCREGGTNETRGRQRGVKVLLDPTVLPPATLVVYGCVWSPSLPVCVHACILTGSSFARKTSLRRPAACRHSSRGVRMLFPPNEVMTSCLRSGRLQPCSSAGLRRNNNWTHAPQEEMRHSNTRSYFSRTIRRSIEFEC